MSTVASLQLAPVLDRLAQSGASYDTKRIEQAFAIVEDFYGDTKHWTGESVLPHVLGILEELALFQPDEDTVIATILSHVLEMKIMTLLELEDQFGPKVRGLVSGIHLLSHVTLEGRRRSIEDLRLMLLSVSDDIRILLVTLCDRARCLQFLGTMNTEYAKRLSQDVLQLFAPVAARLGIYSLKQKLETSTFPFVYPDDAGRIAEQLEHVHIEHPYFLSKAQKAVEDFLKFHNIHAVVDGREKQLFSIFQKMNTKSLTHIDNVHDLFSLRVVVNTEAECYQVLGLLHQLGRPLTNRFKDYIAFPKPNGYQSLHTTLAGFADLPEGCFLEIQVRTEKMNRKAQYGVAAHWSYKEHGATERAMERLQLRSVLIGQEAVYDEEEQSFSDHIFVLTPCGDIVELPENATPLDFAFQIHTDLGLSFRSAKVNGSIVSLDYELENGDVVDVQKHSTPQPSTHWMQLLRMASSRSKLRRYLYAQERPQLIALGREYVNEDLRKRNLPPLTTDLSLLRKCDGETLNLHQREDILMKIGQGAERGSTLLSRLDALSHIDTGFGIKPPKKEKNDECVGRMQRKDSQIQVEGNFSMPLRYAKCCTPQDGAENIVGNINRSGEVMVHRSHCKMFQNTNPDRRVHVEWKS
ncbi:hypothetical protein COU75_03110 [Candidatus Peregrinibacteria bacterium CG10_big_fil_rev_8_21_14_0_10_42_8]|nr:MAG: hypothetical protein COU75_03110 [Candidatus Peregrinibacteria bacterium CG10_big_fil_rev_8_21_14_0_10_42_8]